MMRRIYLLLFVLGLGVASLVAVFQHAPGYMDADYYYAGGLQLATGQGFREPFLWNYLDNPSSLPHASHAYWMPLASMLAAVGMWLSGLLNFTGARAGFLLVAACLPPLTAALAFSLTGKKSQALLAGLLAVVPVYYLPVISTTDNFSLYMLLGGAWFLLAGTKRPFLLGIVAGLMHLARADGLLWLGISVLAVLFPGSGTQSAPAGEPVDFQGGGHPGQRPGLKPGLGWFKVPASRLALLMLGYLVIMGPWMARNLAEFGTPLAPGGGRTLWVTRYDELYAYPASILTPDRWWATGLGPILQVRVEALGQNLVRAFAVQGSIFLTPLILLGLWRLRRDRRVQWGLLAWTLTLFAMTAVFPHQGWRGGFFHSGAALQPLLWAAAPVGLEGFVAWGVRKRGWNLRDAQAVFGAGLVAIGVLLSGLVILGQVIGKDFSAPAWGGSDTVYRELEYNLKAAGAAPGEIVAVNNPAGYFIAAGRQAIAIPDGDESVLLAAAHRYDARFILLEYNHPKGLDPLYQNPADQPGLDYLDSIGGTHLFQVP